MAFAAPILGVAIANDALLGSLRDSWITLHGLKSGFVPGIELVDASAARLASSAFFVNQDLVGWSSVTFRLTGPGGQLLATGAITALAAVPEPSGALLLALALLGLVRRCGRLRGGSALLP